MTSPSVPKQPFTFGKNVRCDLCDERQERGTIASFHSLPEGPAWVCPTCDFAITTLEADG